MSPKGPSEHVDMAEARDDAIEQLSVAFAHDAIELEDFERRVDAAFAATEAEDLRSLVQGLPDAPAATALARVSPQEVAVRLSPVTATLALYDRSADALAVLGNCERAASGRLVDGARATAVLGNVELDLREAILDPGVTHLLCRAVFGNIEIIVPPNLAVECVGRGILGSFAAVHRVPSEGTSHRAVLRIVGSAVFGNVEVHTRPRGLLSGQGSVGQIRMLKGK
jgi:hypothetical protein